MKAAKTYKKDGGKLDLGDLLGRSKDGFQPLNTEDDDAVIISSDSDVEDFSVPALHTWTSKLLETSNNRSMWNSWTLIEPSLNFLHIKQ